MKYQLIIINVALVILVISLIIVYFNLQKPSKIFPPAMSNCPDYWEINPTNGNCIIPSEDAPKANIGNLKSHGKPYYIYNNNNKIDLSTNYKEGATLYTPYQDNNNKIYSYSALHIPAYIDVSLNNNIQPLMKNVNNMKLQNIINGNEINFNDSIAWSKYDKGNPSLCNIKSWINTQNIVWDGLHNYNKCP
jgi:hypothetical protein